MRTCQYPFCGHVFGQEEMSYASSRGEMCLQHAPTAWHAVTEDGRPCTIEDWTGHTLAKDRFVVRGLA